MAQLLIVKELNDLLEQWEDLNLAGDFEFHLNQIIGLNKDKSEASEMAKVMIGSELNLMGLLARAIPDYEKLRRVMGGETFYHKTNFMPRVPTALRSSCENVSDFYDQMFIKCSVRIPFYLLKWMETRRACVVEDSLPIPMVDLRTENWLHRLPYHSMYLTVKSPFVFTDPTEHVDWSVKDFILVKDGNYTRILFWATENAGNRFTHQEREKIRKAIREIQKDKLTDTTKQCMDLMSKANDVFIGDLVIEEGTTMVRDIRGSNNKQELFDLYDPKGKVKDGEVELYLKMKAIVEMVNGFCKLMSQLPPAPAVHSAQTVVSKSPQQPPRQWFELPLQTVDYFYTESSDNKVIIKKGNGSEKSPHIRRGHTRRLVQKDGTTKEVWVGEMTIRKDKLVTEQLQGGALKVQ